MKCERLDLLYFSGASFESSQATVSQASSSQEVASSQSLESVEEIQGGLGDGGDSQAVG